MDDVIIHSHLALINPAWTAGHRNQIITNLIPDFQAATMIVSPYSSHQDMQKVVSQFNKRDVQNALRLSIPHMHMICDYLFFIRDMIVFFNLEPEAFQPNDPDAGYPVYTLQRGRIATQSQQNRIALNEAGAPDMTALGKFPTTASDIHTYLRTTKMVLKKVYGREGVPLSYLVRPDPQPADAVALLNQPGTDYHEAAIHCYPQTNTNRIYDQRALYQFLLPRVVETTALSLAPADHETTEDGAAFYTSIWNYHEVSVQSASAVIDTTTDYRKLYYKDEASLPFDEFISRFKGITKRLAQAGPQHAISAASQILELREKFKAAPPLKGFLGQIPTLGPFESQADMERLIQHAREYLHATGVTKFTSNRNHKRRSVSSAQRAGGRGGRGGGRGRPGGRGGRGKGGRGKPKPKSEKVEDWIGHDRVDNHIWKKWSEADRENWKTAKKQLKSNRDTIISQARSLLTPGSLPENFAQPSQPPPAIQWQPQQSIVSGVTAPATAQAPTQNTNVLPPAGRNRPAQASQTRQQQQQQQEGQTREGSAGSIRVISSRRVSANDAQHPMLGRHYPRGVVTTCEMDNHADTTCCGPNFVPLSETQYYCSVRPFTDSYEAMSNIPVCTCATAITVPATGETMILVFHQSLFFGDQLDHSLINPNQVRHFLGNIVHDHPFDRAHPAAVYHPQVTIPLFMRGTFSCFKSRSPTPEELRTSVHIDMTSSAYWDPKTALENLAQTSALQALSLEEEEPKDVSQVIQLPPDYELIARDMEEKMLKTDLQIASTIKFMDAHSQPHSTRSHNVEVPGDPLYDHEAFVEKLVSGIFVTHWTSQTREVSRVEVVDGELREIDTTLEDLTIPRPHESSDRKLRLTPEHLSEIFHIGLKQAEATLNATTHKGVRSGVMPLARRYKYDGFFGLPRIKDVVYTDTVWAKVRSLHQNICSQLFVFSNGASDTYNMHTKSHAGRALKQFGMDYGYPTHLISDSAPEQVGGNTEFQSICKKKEIDFRRAEPYTHGQNQAEPHVAILRRKWKYLMDRRDVPSRLWDYGWKYSCEIISRTVSSRFGNQGRPPLESIIGDTVDLSEYVEFGFYDWVYFRDGGPGAGTTKLGRWLGVAHSVGNAMCYYVINEKAFVFSTTTVARVPNIDLQKPELIEKCKAWTNAMDDRLDDKKFQIPIDGDNPGIEPESWGQVVSDTDQEYEELMDEQLNDPTIPEADELDYTPDTVGDPYMNMEVLMPNRLDGDGAGAIAKVVGRKRDPDGKPKGTANDNPILDTREYIVEFLDGHQEAYTANVIAENLFASCNEHGQRELLLDQITDYRRSPNALTQQDAWNTSKKGKRTRKRTTVGWQLLFEWKDGTKSWIALKDAKNSHPVEVAEYAIANKIADEPAFAWWVPYVIRKRNRIISKVKSRYWNKTHKFGFKLPKTVQEALEIDKENGNTLWKDAIEQEMRNVLPAFERFDKPLDQMMVGYKKIKLHMVFDIKLGENFRHKARLVAGGHVTTVDANLAYSSVVSRDSVRILFLLAALNDLTVSACDIQNAYITADNREKIYCIAGPEFGSQMGSIFIIKKALYGLRSAGGAFWSLLRSKLRDSMGFVPSKADPDVWMRPATMEDGTEYYQYICCYVDDLIAIGVDSKAMLEQLKDHFKLKNDKVATPSDFLGAQLEYRKIPESIDLHTHAWAFHSKKYVESSIKNVEMNAKERGLSLPKKAPTPLSHNYKPETDTSPELNDKDTQWYQEMIGILRWAIELGRIDINFEVGIMASHTAMPRKGHLEEVLHIFAYLKKEPNKWILMDPAYPPPFEGTETPVESDWSELYPDAEEPIPTDMPKPRGKHVVITCFVDADHASNRVTRRSHTGMIILVNMAPIIWYSKRQNTVESSSFGSEFIAMRIAVDQLQALRYKLRMFGVPLRPQVDKVAEGEVPKDLPATIYCDNQSVVTNSSDCLSKLNKKHNSIAFHRVREASAGGWATVTKVASEHNWADPQTKSMSADKRNPLINNVMY